MNDSIYFIPNDATDNKDIYLKKGTHFQIFTYRFYGDSLMYWNNDKNKCAISLVYVKDKETFKSEKYLNRKEIELASNDFSNNFISVIYSKLK